MVPQPVKAVLILFPITPATEEARHQEEAKLKESGQEVSRKLWFSKQTVSNACGTVAMLHAFANADVQYKAGSFLEAFMKASAELDPLERAKLLENPSEGQPDVERVHQDAGQGGQTAPPPEEENVRSPLSFIMRLLCHFLLLYPLHKAFVYRTKNGVFNSIHTQHTECVYLHR